MLVAIRFIRISWCKVTQAVIKNCFKKTKFASANLKSESVNENIIKAVPEWVAFQQNSEIAFRAM